MRSDVADWFTRRTSAMADWPTDRVLSAKGLTSVAVILPALNEQDTVGQIVAAIRGTLMTDACPLVDELVVVDPGSTDDTAARAAAAGARVVVADGILSQHRRHDGKGDAMWRGLAATTGELVVFVDADLRSFTPAYVTGLLGPLLTDDTVQLVKAVYDRPLITGDVRIAAGGGRVTEILARPLLNALWPDLAGIAQPLAGEYAARRSLLETLAFPAGYGVEVALLVDTFAAHGLDGIAQVDLGQREHRHHDASRLGRMAAQILHAALTRADPHQRVYVAPHRLHLPEFSHDDTGFAVREHHIATAELPPLAEVAEYRARVP